MELSKPSIPDDREAGFLLNAILSDAGESSPERTRYSKTVLLGQGGMGEVWEVVDESLHRPVALKQLREEVGKDDGMVRRFLREAKIMGQLEHPGIAPVHELARDEDGSIYYTMQKVEGDTMQSILDRLQQRDPETLKAWPISALLEAFSKLCETVAFAHDRGVLHRDLKPENVMLGRFGSVVLVDWGIAKPLNLEDDESEGPSTENHALLTMVGSIMGTPGYLSPEAAAGADPYTDGGSDIFSLGAILYQILTLQPPYQGSTVPEVLDLASRGEYLRPHQFKNLPHMPNKGGHIPAGLAAIVLKALSPDRSDRYTKANDLRADIEAVVSGYLPGAQSAGPGEQLLQFIRRNPGPVVSAALACAIMLVAIVGGLWSNRAAKNKAESARDQIVAQKNSYIVAKQSREAELADAAPGFADLAWENLQRGNIETAARLSDAAIEFSAGKPETATKAHLARAVLSGLYGDWVSSQEDSGIAVNENVRAALSSMAKDDTDARVQFLGDRGLHVLALRELKTRDQMLAQMKLWLEEAWGQKDWELVLDSPENIAPDIFNYIAKPKQKDWILLNTRREFTPEKLSFIKGWPVEALKITNPSNTDFEFVAALPELRFFEAHPSLVSDLSPLAQIQPAYIKIGPPLQSNLWNLAPLKSLDTLKALYISNIYSLKPLRNLPLQYLTATGYHREKTLQPLRGMNLRFLEIGVGEDLEALSSMEELKVLRIRDHITYTKQDLEIIASLPVESLQLNHPRHISLDALKDLRHVRSYRTASSHDLAVWKTVPQLRVFEYNGPELDLQGINQTPIERLFLSRYGTKARFALYPLLENSALTKVEAAATAQTRLETPALLSAMLKEDWALADKEFDRLSKDYQQHPALKELARKYLPGLKRDLAAARRGEPCHAYAAPVYWNGNRYQWIKLPMSFQSAADFAESVGGHLISINTKEEWAFLQKLAKPILTDKQLNIPRIWVGATQKGSRGKWRTVTGEPMDWNRLNAKLAAPREWFGDAGALYLYYKAMSIRPTQEHSAWTFLVEWDGVSELN